VYKPLEALVDAGVAGRIAGDNGPTRYDGRSDSHYHLRCTQTGEVGLSRQANGSAGGVALTAARKKVSTPLFRET